MRQVMDKQLLSVAVVGHANTGKTSLIRTLLRDSSFGQIADKAGTTRHVEGAEIRVDNNQSLVIYDTPGLEDSMHLLTVIDAEDDLHHKDGIDRLLAFIEQEHQFPALSQEVKVLKALLSNDIIFYVVDVREPILGKYRDELKILSYAAKPIIPVLNFINAKGADVEAWQTQLARLNLHAFVSFDSVVFRFSDEVKIYQKMKTLLSHREVQLDALINQRQQQWKEREYAAQQLIATLLVEAAACRFKSDNDEKSISIASARLQSTIRDLEQQTLQQLLSLYQFKQDDVDQHDLPIQQGQWELDLFSSDNLQEFGVKATSNFVKGAGVGVAVDLVAAGMTLGAAAVAGGVMGVLWGVKQRYYDEINAKVRGHRYLCADDLTLQVLWARQLNLLFALQQRGHASLTKVSLTNTASDNVTLPKAWSQWLKKARQYPQWLASNNSDQPLLRDKKQLLISKIVAFLAT
jgi:signal recognition particle receptor subunit beta